METKVLGARHRLQVFKAHAVLLAAQVVDVDAVRYFAVGGCVHFSVDARDLPSADAPRTVFDASRVPVASQSAEPDVAGRLVAAVFHTEVER